MKSTKTFLEGLEPRIAPAGLVTFHDVDGDLVTVKSSKGTNTDLAKALTISDAGQLEKVDFTAAVFKGTALDIKVTQRDTSVGDGFVNVGLIDATGNDLNSISVKGDVGKILAGDNNIGTNGVNTIKVHSLGALGTGTQGEVIGADLNSVITGRSNSLNVDTSLDGAITYSNQVTNTASIHTHTNFTTSSTPASIGYVTIGKNLDGSHSVDANAGSVTVQGTLSKFTLGGSMIGGKGDNSGALFAQALGNVSVGSSVTGGGGDGSGTITSANGVASIQVGGNLTGNDGQQSGSIELDNVRLGGTITVGGSVTGGDGIDSGDILTFGSVAKIGIGGNLIGGDGDHSGVITDHSSAPGGSPPLNIINVSALTIGGSIIGGTGDHSGNVFFDRVGSLTIGGSVIGGNFDGPTRASNSGEVSLFSATGIAIGGNIKGGDINDSGMISVFGDVKTFALKGSVIGNDGDGSGSLHLASITGSTLKSTIGGSVLGGDGEDSGLVSLEGAGTHTLAIGGKVMGSDGLGSGSIHAFNNVASLTVGGSVLGGSGDESGSLFLGKPFKFSGPRQSGVEHANVTLQTLSIGGDVLGGDGEDSGTIFLPNNATDLTVGGELTGGSGNESGSIQGNVVTTVSLGHDVTGGRGQDSGGVFYNSGKTFTLGGSIVGTNDGKSSDANGTVQISTVAAVNIGGSIIGGNADNSGSLELGGKGLTENIPGTIPPVTINIGGDIVGGRGAASGDLVSGFNIGPAILTIGGSVEGGSAIQSGQINLNSLASLSIGGDVVGGSGGGGGSIFVGDANGVTITNVTIGGSLIGGTATGTGTFEAGNDHVVSFNVLGDVVGGQNTSGPEPDPMDNSGFITAGTIDTLNVGGSLVAGVTGNESDLNLGAIRVGGMLGTLNVDGSIEGTSDNAFLITAQGNLSSTAKTNLAIGAINILGDANYANILAGYDTTGTTLDGDGGEGGGTAQIGNVHVSGDWHSSSLAAGVNTGRSDQWGADSNFLLNTLKGSNLIASIASIQIDGIASGDVIFVPGNPGSLGDPGSGAPGDPGYVAPTPPTPPTPDTFEVDVQHGFVAEKIGSLNVAGEIYTIPPAPDFVQVGPNAGLVARLVTGEV